MVATGAAYGWFDELFPDLAEAYCITLVEGIAPEELVRRLGGADGTASTEWTESTGVSGLADAAFALLEESGDREQLLAMTRVGAWTLLIEPNGYLGVSEDRALPASVGTRWVSHFVNINGVDSFVWAEDGGLRLAFEPTFCESRWGSDPDGSLDAMRAAGFDFAPDPPDDYAPGLACFALAEHLTGVVLTEDLLRDGAFRCGRAPIR
ncbi:DUF6461 domain-containing protein [Yinghuangia soli]|uniref:DUF6461 domain-containing protein n=1 Tax=Yinghuangia soli TaxID=2908204 RepID=A0AA41U5S0_9ACTN|nr:DUF6461 domain-containing protein [Yinghuangia soli]MCF2532217.1 DUF6461 domain-containing protein [Yinghuangia soli]